MAFGINRAELEEWKSRVRQGEIALLTHYWIHPRYPSFTTVTKAGCADIPKLIEWGRGYGLKEEWIHDRSEYPHFDLIGSKQVSILLAEGHLDQVERFKLAKP